ncbi:MAG: LicD family protein [Lachnospiraceae bacterium]|nr:LicD family protein [Lachnospiraceae bacterium]
MSIKTISYNEDSSLNETQEYILSILKQFLNIAEKMNVKCYMQGGTMLGAIRHKGFIPWDDDVDLGILRDDYEKVIKNIDKYLPENLELRTYWDESDHHYYFSRIVDTRYQIKRMGSAETRYENVWIDIFPLDGMPNKGILLKYHQVRLSFARLFYHLSSIKKVNYKRPGRPFIERMVISIALKIPVDRIFKTQKSLDRIDKLLKKYSVTSSKWIINFMGQTSFKYTEMIDKKVYGKDTYYQFEDIKMLGPEFYDEYLTSLYGNYMAPPKDADKNAHVSELVKQER